MRTYRTRTYRTIDLLKAVYDGKIFKNKFKNVETGEIIKQGINKPKTFFNSKGFNFTPTNIGVSNNLIMWLNEKWEEVQEPIGFMEAMNAYDIGRTVYCKIGQETYTYESKDKNNIFDEIEDDKGTHLSLQEVLNGTWYIKNED